LSESISLRAKPSHFSTVPTNSLTSASMSGFVSCGYSIVSASSLSTTRPRGGLKLNWFGRSSKTVWSPVNGIQTTTRYPAIRPSVT